MGKRIWGENPVQDWLGTCDLAIVLGSIMPQRSTSGIGLQMPNDIVHVLLDGEAIGKNYPAAVPIVANSQAVVQQWLKGQTFEKTVHLVLEVLEESPFKPVSIRHLLNTSMVKSSRKTRAAREARRLAVRA